jgi:thiamine-phosphate diphosphorylase
MIQNEDLNMNTQLHSLPTLYLVTPDPGNENKFINQLEKSLINGIRLVQFRAKNLDLVTYKKLAVKAAACCKNYDAILLVNSTPEIVDEVNAHGVHLDGTRLAEYMRRPLESDKLISAACHSLEQIKKAEILGVNLITLSPVLRTMSHPDAEPLGWTKFAMLAEKTNLPVYALGGMTSQLLEHAQANGAYGVAGIRSFWSD